VGTDTSIKELLSAIKRNPGSPAYAVLAERYLEQNMVDDALRVCQEGFSANPSYERGALAYLNVLRRLKDHQQASEVFGRAVAYVPRSAKLRLAWSMILAETGRDKDARRLAREAMDLDPLNKEARALVATLGGTPTFHTAMPPQADFSSDVKPALEQDHPDEGSLSAQAAAIRPRVRPIGQRTTPHQLFDLTPRPAFHEHVKNLERFGPSPFDITPPPVDVEQLVPEPAAEPEPEPDLQIEPTAPPRPPTPPRPPPVPGQQAPPPVSTAEALPSSDLQRLTERKPRWWLRVLIAIMVLGAAGTGGYLYYQRLQDQAFADGIEEALKGTISDEQSSFLAAQKRLEELHSERRDDPRASGGLALVNAHLVTRFDGDPSLASRTLQMIAGDNSDRARVARALLALHAKKPQEAGLKGLTGDRLDWHARLTRILAHLAQDEIEAAATEIEGALKLPTPSPAILHQAARYYRLRRDPKRSRDLVHRGLKANPRHVGLRIELAILDTQGAGRVPRRSELKQLVKSAGSLARYRARLALLAALVTEKQKDRERTLRLGEEANRLMPEDPEIGTRLGIWRLGAGGTVTKAVALLSRHAPVMSRYDPGVAIWHARALLLSGRPQEARDLLAGTPYERLEDQQQRRYRELEVRCVDYADLPRALARLCTRPRSGLRQRLACVEALLARSQLKAAARLARVIRARRPAWAGYIKGLRALALGDTTLALKHLARVDAKLLPDPIAPRLAQAEALAKQGQVHSAIELLREAVVQDASSVRTRVALAVKLVAGGHDTEAQSILEGVIEDRPTQPSLLAQAGEAFLALGLPQKAQVLIRQAMSTKLQSTSIQLLAGRIELANNQHEAAAKLFNAVLKKQPDNPQALLELGRIMATKRQGARARRYFARALRLRPRDPQLLLDLSRVHALTGDYKKAYTTAVAAIRLLRKSDQTHRVMEALVELARLLRRGDPWAVKKAEEVLYEATKPKNAPTSAYVEMGLLYRQQKDLNRAVWCFRQATVRDPEHAPAHLQLGLTLAKKRRWRKDAVQALKAFLKLRPKGEEAARVRALIKRLK
jgi:tetratricopeptide (TPR) repeat protein